MNKNAFIWAFVGCRILMGIGISASQTSSYAILTLMYPQEVNKAVAIIEGSVGIGLAIGPGFGSLLYHFYGFKGPFFGLAVVYFAMILFVKPCISESVETNPNNELHVSKSNIYDASDFKNPISYRLLLSNRKIWFALMAALANISQFTFIEPFFADFLFEKYTIQPDVIGIIFLAIGLGYAISCQIVSRIVPYFQLRRLLISGLICIGIATLFYAPSQILGFEGKIWFSTTALFFAGLTSAL